MGTGQVGSVKVRNIIVEGCQKGASVNEKSSPTTEIHCNIGSRSVMRLLIYLVAFSEPLALMSPLPASISLSFFFPHFELLVRYLTSLSQECYIFPQLENPVISPLWTRTTAPELTLLQVGV